MFADIGVGEGGGGWERWRGVIKLVFFLEVINVSSHILEFQIEGGRLANFGQNNKRGGWQKSPVLINREVGINGEAGKDCAE